jgi:beta-glucosidase
MPWLDRVHAVLAVWQPGQEDGTAVANLVMGVVNPSGKLPVTFPNTSREGGGSATPEQWPGVVVNGVLTARYTEGLQMGYRWYQAQGKKPVFPFGFGLSYTSFEYAPAVASSARVTQAQPITISAGVRNSGDRAGAEVVQIYAGFPDAYGEPPKRLIGFEKVFLNPGERREVRITLDPSASNHPFSYWNETASRWDLMTGKVLIYVSRSSSDVQSTIEMDAR